MSLLAKIKSHLTGLQTAIVNPENPMWPAVVDIRTGTFPEGEHVPQRVYRLIGAPRGSTLYWDQPLVLSAYALSEISGERQWADSADAYFHAFFERCIGPDGMFLWGNHQYYDVFKEEVVSFTGGYHELRPITPAWELFWGFDKAACEQYIRVMADRHMYDPEIGGFNRHDDKKQSHAFIESGGILAETLAWLYSKTRDADLLETALKIAQYSFSHRGAKTGLLINQPDHKRWDAEAATTETGVWARSLLRAAEYSGNEEFTTMARDTVSAYLKYGYDSETGNFFGQLRADDGRPVDPEEKGYWPGLYSDIWTMEQWPTHDYPMALAEACISLHQLTGKQEFEEAIRRWTHVIARSMPANGGKGTYAENYGRCVHFLTRASRYLQDEDMQALAGDLASEAIESLFADGMFQGYTGSGVYESVDGVGYLLLSLIYLETREEPELSGFGF